LEKGVAKNNRLVMIMFSIKDIEAGNEICWYYGPDYWKNYQI